MVSYLFIWKKSMGVTLRGNILHVQRSKSMQCVRILLDKFDVFGTFPITMVRLQPWPMPGVLRWGILGYFGEGRDI